MRRTQRKCSHFGNLVGETANDIGLTQLVDPEDLDRHTWDYTSLHNAPKADAWISSTPIRASGLYKGIVPARSIQRRDIAVNGAVVRAFPSSLKLAQHLTEYHVVTLV
jgi:hypothetical protein